jgi:hypothetical protein
MADDDVDEENRVWSRFCRAGVMLWKGAGDDLLRRLWGV